MFTLEYIYLRFIVPVTFFFSLELLWWLQIRWLHRSMELPCSLLTPKSRLGEILSHMPLLQGLFSKFILIWNLYNYMLLLKLNIFRKLNNCLMKYWIYDNKVVQVHDRYSKHFQWFNFSKTSNILFHEMKPF